VVVVLIEMQLVLAQLVAVVREIGSTALRVTAVRRLRTWPSASRCCALLQTGAGSGRVLC